MTRFLLCLLTSCALQAQDVRTVTSPNGQLEFRLFVGQPEGSGLSRLAYQVFSHGVRIIDTSYLGIDILDQEPLLGQYIGLTGSTSSKSPEYNELRAQYMQNGSLGRLVDIEVRAYDSRVEFRYLVPRSTPLAEPFTVEDEKTEFAVEPAAAEKVKIHEEGSATYPAMTVAHGEGSVLVTRLARRLEMTTPFTTPWRVISLIR